MTVDQKAVEQLWYTWSDVGLDTIRAGFRIRAASEGLQDYRSLRVQDLDTYQHYALPPDVNPVVISLNMAPVCLALIDTGKERILIRKVYAGRDGVGRYGSFFSHLLAGLPEDFSTMDAILLWRAPSWKVSDASFFWEVSDASLGRRETSLDPVPLNKLKQPLSELEQWRKEILLDPQSAAKIQAYLPYVIQAYLTKKPLIDEKTSRTVPQKLYIAASDDDIARLIFGLACCLPKPLVKGLTFSTYERDVAEATTEIVGTCWLSVPEAQREPHVADLLPASYYTKHLAINCYTGVRSPLENNPLAAQCAQDAMKYFLYGNAEFKDLLERVEYFPNLDVDGFLNRYKMKGEPPSDEILDFVLSPRTSADFAYTEKMLFRLDYQTALIHRALRDPKWWWSPGRAASIRLLEHSVERPKLARALAHIARSAIPLAVNNAREGVALAGTFTLIVDVMFCTAPLATDASVWLLLLQELLTIHNVVVFLNTYVDRQKVPSSFVEDLFQQLAQNPQQWPTARDLFAKLAAGHYRRKLRLLYILLATTMDKEGDAFWLLQKACLTADEIAPFLEGFGPKYLPLANRLSQKILDMFGALAKHDVHKEKIRVLFHWLASSELSTWFDNSAKKEKNLEAVLQVADLSVEESGAFLTRYGQKYFKLYPWSSTLWKLLDRYAASGTQPRLSFIWLHPQVNRETFERGLRTAHLTVDEKIAFLEHHGEYYIPRYPQSQVVFSSIHEYLECLRTADLALFQRSGSADVPSPTEKFLWFLCQPSLQLPLRQLIYAWYVVGAFVRKPALWKGQPEKVGASIVQLQQYIPQETHEKLIKKLAIACLEDEQALPVLVNTLCGVLPPRDLLLMLYDIAESAGESIRQGRDGKNLFVSCLQFALSFQTAFYPEAAQKFVQIFLDTLLLGIDEETYKWLNKKAKKWPSEVSAEWQNYELHYLFSPVKVEPSPVERIMLWWERKVAFTQMWIALRSKSIGKIVQVDTDYMTTLNSYPQEVPDVWWCEVGKALHALNTFEDTQWQQYEYNRQVAAPSSVGKPSWFNRIKLRWKRTVALRQMGMALRSKHIGKIVRVATEHMLTLQTYDAEVADDDEKVADDWWEQIDAAFDFFHACEDADESGDEIGEQIIIDASNRIDALIDAGFPAPRLTMHEKRRKEAAKQYVVYMEAQRMKVANKEKMLALSTAMVTQARPVSLNAETPRRGILWFKK